MSEWLPWARVSASGIEQIASETGMALQRLWSCGERWFALLQAVAAP